MSWANVLGGALTGLSGGLQEIKQQRNVAVEQQLRQRQFEEQQKAQAQEMFLKKLQAMPLDADVDMDTLKEGAGFGMAGMFKRNDATGGFRRVPTTSERADLLDIEATDLERQVNELKLGQTRTAMDPELAKTLLGLPLAERQVRALQLGFKDAPMLPEEELAAAERHPSVIASRRDNATALQVAQIQKQGMLSQNAKMSPEMVEMFRANPDLINKLSKPHVGPTIAAWTATTGEPWPNVQADNKITELQKKIMNIDQLLAHPGFDGAMGTPSLQHPAGLTRWATFGGAGSWPGSPEASFEDLFGSFKGLMTVDQLVHMRGLGHLSDREFGVMSQIGTSVSQRGNPTESRNRLLMQRNIGAKMLERIKSGRRVTDQDDIFTEIGADPAAIVGGQQSQPYRKSGDGNKVYKY
jgi:hypothetical protein